MKTKWLNNITENGNALEEAANLLRHGEVVAFPTETVYGLGADATNEQAVAKIFQAKGRPSDNPLIVHVSRKHQLSQLTKNYPNYVENLISAFSPGPITYVLKSNGKVAANVTAGLETVGVRIPNHPTALALLDACQLPLAAPSANRSGKPSPTTAGHVLEDLDGEIAAILDGGSANVGVESTVLDCTNDVPVILRTGQITKEMLEHIIGKVVVANNQNTVTPKSPGVKYKHYMPEVPLYLIRNQLKAHSVIDEARSLGKRVGMLTAGGKNHPYHVEKTFYMGENDQEMAANLYDTLRQLKKAELDVVFVLIESPEKVGSAVMDRLQRAATEIIN